MRLLITSGPTREPIDDVRYVSNVSSGRLGCEIARTIAAAGHDVVLLRGIGSLAPAPHERIRCEEFQSAESLLALVRRHLGNEEAPVDAMIHAAAVADYAPIRAPGKIRSDHGRLVIEMSPTPKIADEVHRVKPGLPLVLFKLESTSSREELHARARATADRAGAHAIVANLVGQVTPEAHRADLLRADGTFESFASREAIARGLLDEIERLVRGAEKANTR